MAVVEVEVAPRAGHTAKREEAELVASFEELLRALGRDVQRARIRIPGEPHELVTDTFDVTAGVLYEAKSSSDRATIRLAIGQLIDYLRFMPGIRGRLLLPEEPSPDLQQLIRTSGFQLVFWRTDRWVVKKWTRARPRS